MDLDESGNEMKSIENNDNGKDCSISIDNNEVASLDDESIDILRTESNSGNNRNEIIKSEKLSYLNDNFCIFFWFV